MIIPARPPSLYQLVQLSQDQEESFDLDDGQWVPGQSASVNSVMTFIGFFLGNLLEMPFWKFFIFELQTFSYWTLKHFYETSAGKKSQFQSLNLYFLHIFVL